MKNHAELIGLRTYLKKKDNLMVSEGAATNISCELSREREKWFRAVEYFSIVDDVNF